MPGFGNLGGQSSWGRCGTEHSAVGAESFYLQIVDFLNALIVKVHLHKCNTRTCTHNANFHSAHWRRDGGLLSGT